MFLGILLQDMLQPLVQQLEQVPDLLIVVPCLYGESLRLMVKRRSVVIIETNIDRAGTYNVNNSWRWRCEWRLSSE